MSGQIHAEKQSAKSEPEPVDSPEPVPQPSAHKLSSEIDDLLDEIDGVLETNAEEFVAGYVQKGGQ